MQGNQLSNQDRLRGTPSIVGLTALQDPYLVDNKALKPDSDNGSSRTQMMDRQTPMGTFATNLTDKLNRADSVVEPESIQLEFVDQQAEAPAVVQY